MDEHAEKLAGVILGTAVGDALGLPFENLSRRRLRRFTQGRPLRHRFVLGHGMVSDDTEHTCMVGQALLAVSNDPERFARSLAWRFRFWLLCLPAAIGGATLRSIIKLWLGFPPSRSGVWSAGNGPAMRAALLGVCLGEDRDRLRAYIRASTRLTHTDPRAERGAMLVALAAWRGGQGGPESITPLSSLEAIRSRLADSDDELDRLLNQMEAHLKCDAPAEALADALGLRRGVSGYIYHTVPAAIYCWLRSPGNFRRAVEEIIRLGGDVDTTGAIVGGLVGATVGAGGIPVEWVEGLIEWPQSVTWMRSLAGSIAKRFASDKENASVQAPRSFWPARIPRNLLFLAIVLGHVGRRLMPPY
jgi:ADP-ribosylglycohydrolase